MCISFRTSIAHIFYIDFISIRLKIPCKQSKFVLFLKVEAEAEMRLA